jgi:hypothetical protein
MLHIHIFQRAPSIPSRAEPAGRMKVGLTQSLPVYPSDPAGMMVFHLMTAGFVFTESLRAL